MKVSGLVSVTFWRRGLAGALVGDISTSDGVQADNANGIEKTAAKAINRVEFVRSGITINLMNLSAILPHKGGFLSKECFPNIIDRPATLLPGK